MFLKRTGEIIWLTASHFGFADVLLVLSFGEDTGKQISATKSFHLSPGISKINKPHHSESPRLSKQGAVFQASPPEIFIFLPGT